MTNHLPITVYILSFNQSEVIGETIKGIANQTYPIHQLIISDDGSTDDTFEKISHYSEYFNLEKKINNLLIIKQEKNLGIIEHFKRIIPHVMCDLIIGNAGDDISTPDRVEMIAADYLKVGAPRYYLSHHSVKVIDKNNIFIPPVVQQQLTVEGMSTAFALHIGASQALTKYLIVDFPEIKFNTYEDLILGFRAAMLCVYRYIDAPLMYYRLGGVSTSSVKPSEDKVRKHAEATLLQRAVDALHLNRFDLLRLINEKYHSLGLGLKHFSSKGVDDFSGSPAKVYDMNLLDKKLERILSPIIDDLHSKGLLPIVRLIRSPADYFTKAQTENSWSLFLTEGAYISDCHLDYIRYNIFNLEEQGFIALFLDAEGRGSVGDGIQPIFGPLLGLDTLRSNPYPFLFFLVRDGCIDFGGQVETDDVEILSYRIALRVCANFPESVSRLSLPVIRFKPSNYFDKLKNSNLWLGYSKVLTKHLNECDSGADILEGPAPGTFHVIYPLNLTPLVTIIIPACNQLHLLSRCIESLLDKTDYPNYEILLVDNGSSNPEVQKFLTGLQLIDPVRIRVLCVPGVVNFSRMSNQAVADACGDYVLFLNSGTAVLNADWISHMMRHVLRGDVGVVGARLINAEGALHHAGLILGLRGPADFPCVGFKLDEPGYMVRAQIAQNFSAVSAACMLVSRAVYQEVGGLDEVDFPVSYHDIDFCLKVGQTGRRIVWTPLASLLCETSTIQNAGIEHLSEERKSALFTKEQAAMYRKWPGHIANDPAYNPNLSLVEGGYEVETNPLLCFDPLWDFYEHKVVAFAADNMGCGHYRVLQPMQAMLAQDLCIGGASPEIFGPNLALRSRADVLVFQRPNTDASIQTLEALLSLPGIKKIYEIDDNLTRVPMKSAHFGHMPKDIRKRMLKSIGLCDRLVVSTEPLAKEFGSANGDVRVVANRLPPSMWGEMPPAFERKERARGGKPVVAWAGGVGHGGDLHMIAQVIKELADVVDWEFFGMCPDEIRPYVKWVHAGVPTLDYPARLMQLARGWDLAIAPLEVNAFNESKSNLRLLEYGWCGLPVVCSDVTPYQDLAFPVTRVKNRHKDWKSAILDKVGDLEAARRQGQALQEVVARDWVLRGQHVTDWYKAWTD